ncbi:hypothetical protein [Salipiger mucosus]|uniref:Uncharacterized protein n=1 Tax=Salipiger mucosus DSM 16094 TaxID=1123237 RepID=S9Q2N2_9RHOB|nr:hypothetical protein [Salipiger mucosus]EPX75536.1 hypothetical protein Salmuc_04726 [Salipiger mucosus DSM 16094]
MKSNERRRASIGNEELEEILDSALEVEGAEGACGLLRASAAMLEHAAYEIARSEAAGQVSQIILLSAELERIAETREAAIRRTEGEPRRKRGNG